MVRIMMFLIPYQNRWENDAEMRQSKLAVLFGVAWKTPKLTSNCPFSFRQGTHDVVCTVCLESY